MIGSFGLWRITREWFFHKLIIVKKPTVSSIVNIHNVFLVLLLFFAVACDKDKNKTNGVCYCDFADEEKQENDETYLSKSEQLDTCNIHVNNAGPFGGECELKQ
ncbi:hypothetical protein ERX46_09610 [Brumimicrobium glaciale]|uniref:Uncharacterized protein n=1 Tax=Brumimicrobium glaciale TaxID=200475 RepID=A0A4Q4KP05_9FLAO|nr:hypothetical protein [Brumimicrobium glaciale]RYM34204.1 hypothetical protein ERX46_09610 [Brumimicrobium glaciale]